MRAVNIVDQVCELVARDCLLVVLENIPSRLIPEDTDVLRGANCQRKKQQKE